MNFRQAAREECDDAAGPAWGCGDSKPNGPRPRRSWQGHHYKHQFTGSGAHKEFSISLCFALVHTLLIIFCSPRRYCCVAFSARLCFALADLSHEPSAELAARGVLFCRCTLSSWGINSGVAFSERDHCNHYCCWSKK
jgi:hypothetical protein